MDRTTSMLATPLGKRLRRGMVLAVLVVTLVAALMPTAAFASSRYGRSSYSHNHSYHQQHHNWNQRGSKKHYRCATTYRVRRGDTLTKIARKYRTSIHSLAKANGIRNVNRIIAGQTLCIR